MKGLECRGGGKAARETERERDCPRQRDIVQIAESGDIDHRGASAAEPLGTDTSDLAIPLQPPSVRPTAAVSVLHRPSTCRAGSHIYHVVIHPDTLLTFPNVAPAHLLNLSSAAESCPRYYSSFYFLLVPEFR